MGQRKVSVDNTASNWHKSDMSEVRSSWSGSGNKDRRPQVWFLGAAMVCADSWSATGDVCFSVFLADVFASFLSSWLRKTLLASWLHGFVGVCRNQTLSIRIPQPRPTPKQRPQHQLLLVCSSSYSTASNNHNNNSNNKNSNKKRLVQLPLQLHLHKPQQLQQLQLQQESQNKQEPTSNRRQPTTTCK